MAIYNKMKEEEKVLILSNKYTRKELSKILKRNIQTISRWVRDLSANPLYSEKSTKYTHDVDYFRKWSRNMAYVLGFICADGNVSRTSRNGGTLHIGLAKKDKNHLEKLKGLLKTEVPIYENKNAVILAICSITIVNSLIELGVMERKSTILKWINNIPDEYINHFIRGYFDGDGTVLVTKNRDTRNKNEYIYKRLQISILGTEDFLNGIKKEFCKFYGKEVGNVIKMKQCNAYRYSLASRSAIYFCKYIYKDSNAGNRMDRKYSRYRDFCDLNAIDIS